MSADGQTMCVRHTCGPSRPRRCGPRPAASQRPGAEREAVVRVVDGIEEPSDVFVARHYARQAQDGKWRVVGMHAHAHVVLIAYGHYRLEEIAHVLAQLVFGDALVQVEQLAEELHRVLIVLADGAADKPLRLHDDVFHQLVVVVGSHGLLQFLHFLQYICRPVGSCSFALQYANVEIGKLSMREIKVGCAVWVGVLQVGAGPVKHRL